MRAGGDDDGAVGTDASAEIGERDGGLTLLLQPVQAANAFEESVQRLLQSIRLGLAAAGDRLPPERELARLLGVSRDTVREAIAALADAGYLHARRGRYGGTFVVDPVPDAPPASAGALGRRLVSPSQLHDTLALRSVLEVGAARRAASAELSGADRDRLWRAFEDSRGAAAGEYRRLDARLHLLLGELVGSPTLLPLLADVRMRVNDALDRIPLLAPNIAHSDEQHERIVSAVLRGDADGAAAAMDEHLAGSEALLVGFLA